MATQITFVGGERIGVMQPLEEVVKALNVDSPGTAAATLVQFNREDGTSVHINPAHVLYVRTVA